MAQRQYEPFTLFNVRIVDMRHLWNPSTEYEGKKQDKASYFASFIVPKTQPTWFAEPALAPVAAACAKFPSIMQAYQTSPHAVEWPINDGNLPNKKGKLSDFAQNHWIFSASTYDSPPNVELVQAGGALVKLPNKVGVKSGDYVMLGATAALNSNDARKLKLYLNAVVFSGPGEEIVFANSVSGAELMQQAQRQGLQVAGFQGAPGFGGFAPPTGGPMHGQQFAAPQVAGFQGAPGFGGFAPPTGGPAFPGVSAPSTATTFPSNPANPFGQR